MAKETTASPESKAETTSAEDPVTEKVNTSAGGEKPKEANTRMVILTYDEEHKDPLFVGLNGVGYLIKRGEPVIVPTAVAEIIENSNKQRMNSIRYMDEHADTNPNK